ncbi:MAG: gamma-glutamyltransferase [Balneolaceae bacterium]|nr:gamma-glutamyltransferase [Balneolaceae bacterium]MCH8548963.1 gamma-glutamyltransferase [Balneolaceae bacterium]
MILKRLLLLTVLSLFALTVSAQISAPPTFQNGVVSSADRYASEAGLSILQQGGNAVDAAVAVQFALAVTLPRAGNIGGGGFMVLHLEDGTVTTLDFREKAPHNARRDMFLDEDGEFNPDKSQIGGLASGVPGTVDGMISALERYGTLPLEVVMEPAIQLAIEGYRLTESQARSLNNAAENLSRFEGSKATFLRSNGEAWQAGDLFIQGDLGQTLRRIAQMGRRGFYSGITANLIIQEMQRSGGIITMRDLRDYRSVWREPVTTNFNDYTLHMMGPPSSGGLVMKQVLGMIEDRLDEETGFNSAEYVHLVSEALRRAFADRNHWLGDPDFTDIPNEELTDRGYLEQRMESFNPDRVTPSDEVSHGEFESVSEAYETTHFNVVDSRGNAVAVNTTINGSFGSFVTVTGAGFLLNNEMDDFSAKPGEPNMFGLIGAEANSIEPGKRMLSSMSPTIAVKDGKVRFVAGGAGGPRIITATLQNFLNVSLFGMNAVESITAPRFHHQWLPDRLLIEPLWFSKDTIDLLRKKGHDIQFVNSLALIHSITIDEEGRMSGAADPRADGSVQGF